jgi:hypothetical protein
MGACGGSMGECGGSMGECGGSMVRAPGCYPSGNGFESPGWDRWLCPVTLLLGGQNKGWCGAAASITCGGAGTFQAGGEGRSRACGGMNICDFPGPIS